MVTLLDVVRSGSVQLGCVLGRFAVAGGSASLVVVGLVLLQVSGGSDSVVELSLLGVLSFTQETTGTSSWSILTSS